MATALINAEVIFQQEGESRFAEVNRFYRRCRDRSKTQPTDRVYTLMISGELVAALRLQRRGSIFFLRSVCVEPNLRRQGLALRLIKAAVAEQNGLSGYCFLHIELQALYIKAGFVRADIELAESAVRDQFCRLNKGGGMVYMVV